MNITANAAAIEAHQFSKSFGDTLALAPLDLLVGHNGAGKTTLIKLLMNILQPTSGHATILGEETSGLTGQSLTRIGYVSENQEMPDWMTVQGMMDYLRPFYPTWDDANLLEELDLPPKRKLKHLSRGMRMKAALASVLAFRPPLILMDEPFSGLDPLVRDELIEALMDRMNADRDSAEDSSTTILISSHDLAEIESFATHVGFLHHGKLLFAEPMATLSARFREVTVTLAPSDVPAKSSASAPYPSWLLPESSPTMYRFIHTHADTEPIDEQIATAFPNVVSVQSEPMTLRQIFLSLAKSGRTTTTKQDRSRA